MKRTRRLLSETRRNGLPGDPRLKKRIRVLLADELTLVRDGLRLLINTQHDMEVVAEAADEAQALDRFKAVNPDVVVLDVSVPSLTSLTTARSLLRNYPGIKLVVLTGREEADGFPKLVRAKIRGLVLKESPTGEFLRTIRKVARGEVCFDSGATTKSPRPHFAVSRDEKNAGRSLTTREETVLRLVALGHTNKEIAARLSLSPKTIEAHKSRIAKKLGENGRAHMVRYALRRGWMAEEAVFSPPPAGENR